MSVDRPAITVKDLSKSYGATEAVRGVSFTVEAGEVFGLLGPNGAGKTSIVEILEGYRRPDAGTVSVLGFDPFTAGRPLREQLGVVLQESAVPAFLSVREVVELFAGYYPHPRTSGEVIELVGLGDKASSRVNRLSGGQKRRLDLALALVGDPQLVFLDEPTTGFDPSARRAAWELIDNVRMLGKTVLLTTHYMEEAQVLADRICVVSEGRIVAIGTPQTIGGRQTGGVRIRFQLPPDVDIEAVPAACQLIDGVVTVESQTPTRTVSEITAWAVARGLELVGLEVARPSLEDVYLELTAS